MRNRGQGIFEYSVLILIVAAAFTAMSVYVQRAMQGNSVAIEESRIPRNVTHSDVDGVFSWK